MEAWWVLLVSHFALHWMSYERLSKNTILTRDELLNPTTQLDFVQRLGRMVYLASRLHLLRMTCLTRAIALRWMLAQRGIPAQLRIGANKFNDGVHAHAWVEIEGQAIGEGENITERYHLFISSDHSLL